MGPLYCTFGITMSDLAFVEPSFSSLLVREHLNIFLMVKRHFFFNYFCPVTQAVEPFSITTLYYLYILVQFLSLSIFFL